MIKKIAVDCSVTGGNPGNAEYRGVDADTGKILFEYKFPSKFTNNLAEWVAIAHAIKYCNDNGLYKTIIYSDSKYAISWIKEKRHKSKFKTDWPQLYTEKADKIINYVNDYIKSAKYKNPIIWWNKKKHGKEIKADYGRK